MPGWFFVLLLVLVAFAVFIAVGMGYSRRGSGAAGGQNTTVIERAPQSQPQNTTVIERERSRQPQNTTGVDRD